MCFRYNVELRSMTVRTFIIFFVYSTLLSFRNVFRRGNIEVWLIWKRMCCYCVGMPALTIRRAHKYMLTRRYMYVCVQRWSFVYCVAIGTGESIHRGQSSVREWSNWLWRREWGRASTRGDNWIMCSVVFKSTAHPSLTCTMYIHVQLHPTYTVVQC